MIRYLLLLVCVCHSVHLLAGPHTIQRGETFDDLANLYGISVDSLKKANPDTDTYLGYTIEVPVDNLYYDLGNSDLFRTIRYKYNAHDGKGEYAYKEGHKKHYELLRTDPNNEKLKRKILNDYEQAISYGNVDALYALGSYYVHGRFYQPKKQPTFEWSINPNLDEFKIGIEYLQIAALVDKRPDAIVELAVATGHEDSPIRNSKMCLSMLEHCNNELNHPTNELLCYMYEYGYGIAQDYIKAYTHCGDLILTNGNGEKTHRELIMEKVEALPDNSENKKYGVGFNSKMLYAYGTSVHYKNDLMEPEGFFWLHRAARLKNGDANWALSCLLSDKKYIKQKSDGTLSEQVLHFAYDAASAGIEEAMDFVDQYEQYLAEKKRQEQIQYEIRQRQLAEEKRQRQEQWMNLAQGVLQVAAQTYAAVEQSKYQQKAQSNTNFPTQTSFNAGNMTGGNLDYLLDPRYAMAQVQQQEYEEYLQFRNFFKNPDGSPLTFEQYMNLKAQALNKLKEDGVDLVAEGYEELRREREEWKEELKKEKEKRLKQMHERNSLLIGTDYGSTTSNTGSTTTETTNTNSGSGSTLTNEGRNTNTDTDDVKYFKEQFNSNPVSGDEYKYVKKITLYRRDGDKAIAMMQGVELYRKGAFYFVKIGDKFYKRLSSNWSAFPNNIAYGQIHLYYVD